MLASSHQVFLSVIAGKGIVTGDRAEIEYTWIIHFSFNIILKLNQYDQ